MQVPTNKHRAVEQQQQQQQKPHDDTRSQPIVHSGRLVYANPWDLPSFPSTGLDANGSAASAAATLGWANQKSPAVWKPGTSAAASTAATMADDNKFVAGREPAASSSDGARAALLAAQSATGQHPRKPAATDNSMLAATTAFRLNRASTRNADAGQPERQKSLMAAKGAVARRQRAESTPVPRESYPDEMNAMVNALSAANRAHRPPLSPTHMVEAGAIPYTTMNKLMFTSRPPVKGQVDEQRRADVLHASAVAMARKLYEAQQKRNDAARKREMDELRGPVDVEVSSSVSDDRQPAQLTTLQDAAYKQAQARLAKMQQENRPNQDLQEYYGTRSSRPLGPRFAFAGKLRKRAFSDGAMIEDQKRSQQIREQMSLFTHRLSEMGEKKRLRDQDSLLAAAQRNVHERLKMMDEKIASETGMIPPATQTQWELKVRAIEHSHAQRETQRPGMVDIGSGKYMKQDEIDVIAARRVQPILDEINERAESERARQTELRLDQERRKEEQEVERTRQRETREIQKKIKQQEKREQKERKAEERREDKAVQAGHVNLTDTERAASASFARLSLEDPEEGHHYATTADDNDQSSTFSPETTQEDQTTRNQPPETDSTPMAGSREKSPSGRVKAWFKNRFSRNSKSVDETTRPEVGFIGGASANLQKQKRDNSRNSLDNHSARAVAMAGRGSSSPLEGRQPDGVSPLSSPNTSEEYIRGRAIDVPTDSLMPPRPIKEPSTQHKASPPRDSRFREIID
ncbi:hypothetical protein GGS20DRAFT_581762 [Poronia punctata]|nr:hypothetical protein GGS20DRAFT_581762 [Poronia punctata]